MNMNDAMRALVGERVRDVELHSELRPYADALHAWVDGALLNVLLARARHPRAGYPSISAYEASINHLYIDDFVDSSLTELVAQALAFARHVARAAGNDAVDLLFVIVVGGTGCSVCYNVHRAADAPPVEALDVPMMSIGSAELTAI